MSDFGRYVMSYLNRAIIVAVPAVLLCAALLIAAAKRYRKKYGEERKFPWRKAILTLMLAGYLSVVVFVTVQRGGVGYGNHYANLHLFRAWREAWNDFSEKSWLNVLLNIGMFVPLGILLPLRWEKFRKWYRMLGAGFLTTLAIEIVQYFSFRGLFDVDDLFNNTLGAMLGFFLVMAALRAWQKRFGRSLLHCTALLLAGAAIGSVFLAYDRQEFGNLPEAPAFRVNTGDTQWTTACELDEAEQTVSVYWLQPPTREECEAFGREFMQARGAEQVDVTYYNEEVYLREYMGNTIMEVFYLDGTYDYFDLDYSYGEEPRQTQTDEQTIRSALTEFGIQLPETAEFYINADMDHCFTVERYVDGDTMVDGKIKCAYYEEAGICSITNELRTFTYYGEAEIISPAAAVERLKSGWITGGEWFERKQPGEVEILSCTLSYRVDTKGFYQPVYLIEVKSADTNYQETALIPALK